MPPSRVQAEAAPALTALVVYLRPAPRAPLLGALAGLGIFVTERQGAPAAYPLDHADLCLVIANEHDLPLVQRLAVAFPIVVACVPEHVRSASAAADPLVRWITDADLGDHVALGAAAKRARSIRGELRPRPARVFADLELDLSPATLRRGRVSLPLSQSERELLRMLAASLGRAIPQAELERAAACGAAVHPGFLKAVVMRIRRKVEELGGNAALLRTVRGFGYALDA